MIIFCFFLPFSEIAQHPSIADTERIGSKSRILDSGEPDTISVDKVANLEFHSITQAESSGDVAYTVVNSNFVQIYNISDRNQVTLLNEMKFTPTAYITAIQLSNNRLFLGVDTELLIYDVSNHSSPIIETKIQNFSDNINQIRIHKNKVYASTLYEFIIIDLYDFSKVFSYAEFGDTTFIYDFYLHPSDQVVVLFLSFSIAVLNYTDPNPHLTPLDLPRRNLSVKLYVDQQYDQMICFYQTIDDILIKVDFTNFSNINYTSYTMDAPFEAIFLSQDTFIGIVKDGMEYSANKYNISENNFEICNHIYQIPGRFYSFGYYSWNAEICLISANGQGLHIFTHYNFTNWQKFSSFDHGGAQFYEYIVQDDFLFVLTESSIEIYLINFWTYNVEHFYAYDFVFHYNLTFDDSSMLDVIGNHLFVSEGNQLFRFSWIQENLTLLEHIIFSELIADVHFREDFLYLLTVNSSMVENDNSNWSSYINLNIYSLSSFTENVSLLFSTTLDVQYHRVKVGQGDIFAVYTATHIFLSARSLLLRVFSLNDFLYSDHTSKVVEPIYTMSDSSILGFYQLLLNSETQCIIAYASGYYFLYNISNPNFITNRTCNAMTTHDLIAMTCLGKTLITYRSSPNEDYLEFLQLTSEMQVNLVNSTSLNLNNYLNEVKIFHELLFGRDGYGLVIFKIGEIPDFDDSQESKKKITLPALSLILPSLIALVLAIGKSKKFAIFENID